MRINPRSSCSARRGSLEGRLLWICLLLLVTGGLFLVKMPTQIAAMEEQRRNNSELHEFAELFAEIYQQIQARYVDEIESQKVFEGAINGMMMALDPHSSWMPPAMQEQLTRDTEGEYSGVGLVITQRDGVLTVISPLPSSPAAKVGVAPWDRIIEIEGESTREMPLPDAVKRLTGPSGTKVTIKVVREGADEPLDFTITRETVHVDSVFSQTLEGNIGYLRIARFQEDTAREVRKAVENFNKQNVAGLVVDLRNDAGGLLDKAVDICDIFLPEGKLIVSIKGRNPSDNRNYYALEGQLARQPMVVLVNKGSASASEIFAGAMKDHKRGVIVGPEGTNTFGKGSVQTISTLRHSLERTEGGDIKPSGLRLTTARYYTPSGESIHEKGIEPDIGVKLPEGHEIELIKRGALLGEHNTIEPGKPADAATTDTTTIEPVEEGPFSDIMLDEAIKILKTMIVTSQVAKG